MELNGGVAVRLDDWLACLGSMLDEATLVQRVPDCLIEHMRSRAVVTACNLHALCTLAPGPLLRR